METRHGYKSLITKHAQVVINYMKHQYLASFPGLLSLPLDLIMHLQYVIKNWRWGSPGNEANQYQYTWTSLCSVASFRRARRNWFSLCSTASASCIASRAVEERKRVYMYLTNHLLKQCTCSYICETTCIRVQFQEQCIGGGGGLVWAGAHQPSNFCYHDWLWTFVQP